MGENSEWEEDKREVQGEIRDGGKVRENAEAWPHRTGKRTTFLFDFVKI